MHLILHYVIQKWLKLQFSFYGKMLGNRYYKYSHHIRSDLHSSLPFRKLLPTYPPTNRPTNRHRLANQQTVIRVLYWEFTLAIIRAIGFFFRERTQEPFLRKVCVDCAIPFPLFTCSRHKVASWSYCPIYFLWLYLVSFPIQVPIYQQHFDSSINNSGASFVLVTIWSWY